MSFAVKLLKLRTEKNLTQDALAKISGISKRSIVDYEKGESRPRNRTRYALLAEVLECDAAYLEDDDIQVFLDDARKKYGPSGAAQAKKAISDVKALFAGGEMDEEDMDEMLKAIQDAYWIAKEKNKKKKAPDNPVSDA